LAREAETPGFAGSILAEALGATALVDIARYLQLTNKSDEDGVGKFAAWQLRRIKDYIDGLDHYSPTTMDLARLTGFSRRHLHRTFLRTTGQTLHQYIEALRFEKAKSLLLGSELSMKQISAKLGFANQSSFGIAFRRASGQSPTEFRKQFALRFSSRGT